jgi:serine/threonine protein kinase
MVVMGYIDAQPKPPPNVRGQIERVLTLLHANGYVFGDLREPNVLFDADRKVKFVDFNWCGRHDMEIRDENLADGRQKQIENMGRVQVRGGPYAYYLLTMSTVEGMSAPGMEPLTQIRPEHDWMMFDMLAW